MCLSNSPGGMRRAPGTICADPLNACSLLRSITRTSTGSERAAIAVLESRCAQPNSGARANASRPASTRQRQGRRRPQAFRSLAAYRITCGRTRLPYTTPDMTAAADQAIDAAPSIAANCAGGMRRIPASGATSRLKPGMNLAAATVMAGRRRKRRSARPTHASGLSDRRQSSPSTCRPWIRPKAYQAKSPIQKPPALAITSGTAENRYSAATLPASNSNGNAGAGAPRLSMSEAAKTTAEPRVSSS